MRIDMPPKDVWLALCDRYRAELPFQGDKGFHTQVFLGYQHAVWELSQGLAKLFSHKKTIAIVEPQELALQSVSTWFSEEGYTIKSVTAAELLDPAAWITPIQSDLLFVLFSEDDPVTGQTYSHAALQTFAKDKRVFTISVSHEAFRHAPIEKPMAYAARILSLTPERALMLGGDRVRVTPTSATILPWTLDSTEKAKASMTSHSADELAKWKTEVEAFESSLPAGFKAHFKPGDARLYDRAVIYHEGFDGTAVVDELARRMNVEVSAPGAPAQLEATSSCRWENPRFTEWLVGRGESEEKVRGTVIISASLLANNAREHLKGAAAAIEKMQNGTA